ncbi:hypothetical protein T310_1238 [Rasamsonia emersonii CBS 393.64]|uniref:Uncharacterized protein n=1 Tax=Rasamsonia emersonii (strain ATCC 16479 / CBS 393.64 / IMI 116815) TaxID=1408163 RepID=A0A0F4Z4H6_RASE3|nr:hypothetical protein T310_1238 [Rasamsonia emersonii CBS 393.64]KKA24773.1 hypothetical protein T310_1238 [Rasamsonia emersonii CBS 393.64]
MLHLCILSAKSLLTPGLVAWCQSAKLQSFAGLSIAALARLRSRERSIRDHGLHTHLPDLLPVWNRSEPMSLQGGWSDLGVFHVSLGWDHMLAGFDLLWMLGDKDRERIAGISG